MDAITYSSTLSFFHSYVPLGPGSELEVQVKGDRSATHNFIRIGIMTN